MPFSEERERVRIESLETQQEGKHDAKPFITIQPHFIM